MNRLGPVSSTFFWNLGGSGGNEVEVDLSVGSTWITSLMLWEVQPPPTLWYKLDEEAVEMK